MVFATVIFIISYIFIALEKIPNAIITMLGAFVLVTFQILTQDQALHFIDFNTIGLLCGMMMVVAVLRKTGIFEYIAIKAIKASGGDPAKILVAISFITAILSAFLDNVTTVLIVVPITFALADSLKIPPMSFLIAAILFSNIGGTATLIGDPPNIMIGASAKLGFMEFIYNNAPVVILISFFVAWALKRIYKKDLLPKVDAENILQAFDETKTITDRKFLFRSMIVFFLIILAFITHNLHKIDLATIALGGGFTLLLVTNMHPEEILKEVEWSTLFFFTGLFILVGGLENTGVILKLAMSLVKITGGALKPLTLSILWGSAFLSSFIDNVPYTATMISVIKSIAKLSTVNILPLWWALSLGACLGGNGTIIGAAANIVVVGFARRSNYPIKFWDYLKVGFPIMIGTIMITTVYIYLRYLL